MRTAPPPRQTPDEHLAEAQLRASQLLKLCEVFSRTDPELMAEPARLLAALSVLQEQAEALSQQLDALEATLRGESDGSSG